MHEVLFTKGDVRGVEHLAPLLDDRCNCVLVHHGQCHEQAATITGQLKVVAHLLEWEGITAMRQYIQAMSMQMKGRQGAFALKLVEEVYYEVQSMQEGN